MKVIGLTDDGRLVSFRADSPRKVRDIAAVTGLAGNDIELVGIDFRVQDGKLYGVGNGGGVDTIDATTARAQLVNNLTVPLDGVRGVTVANRAFATLSVNGKYSFYGVNLTTGSAVLIGAFDDQVVDIAITLNQ